MLRPLAAALLLLFASAPAAGAAETLSPAARRDFQFAGRLYAEGEFAAAKEEFRRFAERYGTDFPENASEARFWEAVSLARMGAERQAAEAFSEYLRRHPDGPRAREARWERATALYRAGAYAEAEERLLEILQVETGERRCEAEYWLGRTYAAMDRPREAAPYLDAAMTSCSEAAWVPDALYALAYAYDRGGREGEAIEAAGRILTAHPGTSAAAGAAALVGEIYYRRGDFVSARAHYDSAHRIAAAARIPEAADYLYWRGWAAIRAGDLAGGRADLAAIVDSYAESPRRPDAIDLLGRLAAERAETETARRWYGLLVRDHAGGAAEARGRHALAVLALAGGDAAAALEEAERVVEIGGDLAPRARLVRARALLALGRQAEAAAAYESLVGETGAVGWEARIGAAEAYGALGDYAKAAEILGEARTWDGRFRYGEYLFQLGRTEEAIAAWREVVEKAPEADRATAEAAAYWIGAAHYRAGRFAEAAAALQAFAADRPLSPLRPEALYWLGWARLKAGDVEGAVEAFRRCAAVPGPRAAQAALHAARAYAAAERWTAAIGAYRAVCDSFPDLCDEATLAAADAQVRAGRTAEALATLTRVERGAPFSEAAAVEALWRRGEVLEAADSPAEAVAAFTAFAERHAADPRRGEALFRAGRAAAAAGRAGEAERLLGEAAGESVVAPKALRALGGLLEGRGETLAAAAVYDRLADSHAGSPLAGEARVRAASIRGDRTALEAIVRDDPANACLAHLEIGRLNLFAGGVDDAVQALTTALACVPDGELAAEAEVLLGFAEERRGRKGEAVRHFRRVVLLFPESRHAATAREALGRLEGGAPDRGRRRR